MAEGVACRQGAYRGDEEGAEVLAHATEEAGAGAQRKKVEDEEEEVGGQIEQPRGGHRETQRKQAMLRFGR